MHGSPAPRSNTTTEPDSLRVSDADGPPSLPSYSSLHAERSQHWRIHDRTHLELLVDYPLNGGAGVGKYVWEAFFFLPHSLKLDASSYSKNAVYRDFQSYVRFAALEPSIDELCSLPSEWPEQTFEETAPAMLALRLYGARFRVAALRGRERLLRHLEDAVDPYLSARLSEFVAGMRNALKSFRVAMEQRMSPAVAAAVHALDEDLSRVVEEVFSTLCVRLRELAAEDLAKAAEAVALGEARYRVDRGWEGPRRDSRSSIDEAELRRHALKRFTSSVLWISRDISEAGTWVRQALFAVAASVAMVFAVLAAFYYGAQDPTRIGNVGMWILLVVVAYALKDRIKASLQSVFSGWISRRFADRRWKLTYVDGRRKIGVVEERSRFVPASAIPAEVSRARLLERDQPFEDVAHPERVLSHRKDVTLRCQDIARLGRPFAAVTEIFRLDVRRWLVHTDDPKQRVYFADLERGAVASALARRIYHVDIVYRIRALRDEGAMWHQCRVVLNRNGIRSVERIR